MQALKKLLGAVALAAALMAGAIVAFRDDQAKGVLLGRDPAVPTFTFCTAPSATTPQLPFWSAFRRGRLQPLFNVRLTLWKDVDDLKSSVLAGKGDLWLGHTDAFGLARRRGAPVALLAVTGWRKFYLLSTRPEPRRLEDFVGYDLPFAPMGSPAVPIMKALLGPRADLVAFQPQEPMQLAMLLRRGTIDSALVPEPQVTLLLESVKGLRVVLNLEEEYGRRMGGPPRMPIAGIAVNTGTAAKYPEQVRRLLAALADEAGAIETDPAQAVDTLPDSFADFIPREVVRKSLERDVVLVKPAAEVENELAAYFKLMAPALVTPDNRLVDPSLIWR